MQILSGILLAALLASSALGESSTRPAAKPPVVNLLGWWGYL